MFTLDPREAVTTIDATDLNPAMSQWWRWQLCERRFLHYIINHSPITTSTYLPILISSFPWTGEEYTKFIAALKQFVEQLDPDKHYYTIIHEASTSEYYKIICTIPNLTIYDDCNCAHSLEEAGVQTGPNGSVKAIPNLFGERWDKPEVKSQAKTIFASFIGNIHTHPLRVKMFKALNGHDEYLLYHTDNTPERPSIGNSEYLDIMERSIFALAPRGFSNTTFRQYEAFLCGSIPVYISDDFWLPRWPGVDWDDLIVRVSTLELPHLDHILKNISDKKIKQMNNNIRDFIPTYLSWETVFKYITTDQLWTPLNDQF